MAEGRCVRDANLRCDQGIPREERFGLVTQMRRASVSVPSNIAEGQARHTTREFIQFLSHSEGSLAELETQLILSMNLGLCRKPSGNSLLGAVDELRRMLNALRRMLSKRLA